MHGSLACMLLFQARPDQTRPDQTMPRQATPRHARHRPGIAQAMQISAHAASCHPCPVPTSAPPTLLSRPASRQRRPSSRPMMRHRRDISRLDTVIALHDDNETDHSHQSASQCTPRACVSQRKTERCRGPALAPGAAVRDRACEILMGSEIIIIITRTVIAILSILIMTMIIITMLMLIILTTTVTEHV